MESAKWGKNGKKRPQQGHGTGAKKGTEKSA